MNIKKIYSWITVVVLVATVLFFSFFVILESTHHCNDGDCPICACLQVCEQTLHQIGDGAFVPIDMTALTLTIVSVVICFESFATINSLVAQKVRLNR
ncbi:MAG: hypothetical protein K6E64_00320 [Lachnospiraceae bacterium]|nr:hypothetical protein [Lachnospiraceae bacterium]